MTLSWIYKKKSSLSEYDQKLHNATKVRIYNHLKSHNEIEYPREELLKSVEESVNHPHYKKYIRKNGKHILNEMESTEIIKKSQKGGNRYYFFNKN